MIGIETSPKAMVAEETGRADIRDLPVCGDPLPRIAWEPLFEGLRRWRRLSGRWRRAAVLLTSTTFLLVSAFWNLPESQSSNLG